MATYTESTSRSKLVVLRPQITRAFWSQRRAWQGAELKLYIETRHIPDGTKFKVEIWEDGTDEGGDDEKIVEVDGSHEITKGRCEIEYTLALDPDTLGSDLELEGDDWELYFLVKFDKPELTGRSGLLYVDLQPLIISI